MEIIKRDRNVGFSLRSGGGGGGGEEPGRRDRGRKDRRVQQSFHDNLRRYDSKAPSSWGLAWPRFWAPGLDWAPPLGLV
jgi:hypothetical protein